MRFRQNLWATFRGVTAQEYEALAVAAAERALMEPEERSGFAAPAEADASVVGAALWATFVLWQDHPVFVMCGTAGLLITTALRIVHLFK